MRNIVKFTGVLGLTFLAGCMGTDAERAAVGAAAGAVAADVMDGNVLAGAAAGAAAGALCDDAGVCR
jgi:hypothetical protein